MVLSYTQGGVGFGQSGVVRDATQAQYVAIREMRAYWEALRDDQDLPRREQINPRGMAGALHQVFMVERIAPGMARFRLAGMEINDLMGMEVRGMPLSALFEPTARARLAELLEKVITTRAIVEMDLAADRGIGRPALRARLLLLPLLGSAGEADLVLGCLACDGRIGRAPRRFVIARAVEAVVGSTPAAKQRLHLQMSNEATKTAFGPRAVVQRAVVQADPVAPKPAFKAKAERPYLRLVQMDA